MRETCGVRIVILTVRAVRVLPVQVSGFNHSQPQYAYAVGAVGIVCLCTLLSISYFNYREGGLNTHCVHSLAAAEAVILGFGE